MRIQAKDIPVRDVLESVRSFGGRFSNCYAIHEQDFSNVPFKVLRAKMDKLGKQGLVDCCCNLCGHWIKLTAKGRQTLKVGQ